MYKFWIKTVVLYPKMYIWYRKNKKIVLFILKMKFLQKKKSLKCTNFKKKLEFGTQKFTDGPEKWKNCTFYTKNEVFTKEFR